MQPKILIKMPIIGNVKKRKSFLDIFDNPIDPVLMSKM